jgi:hypothetical protein
MPRKRIGDEEALMTVLRSLAGLVRGEGRRFAGAFGITLLALLAAGAISPAGAVAEPTCTDTWTGASEGEWSTATNWSKGTVPSSSDVACVGSGKTAHVAAGSNHAGVVQGKGALRITGGSLEVSSASEASSIASLIQSEGTLSGAATVEASGSFEWTGGTMSGSGKTIVAGSVTGTVRSNLLAQRTLVNEGTLSTSGLFEMSNGAQLQNRGTFKDNQEGSPGELSIAIAPGSTSSPSILNTGTFEKTESESGGTHETRVAVPFENHKTVSARGGTLYFTEGGSSNASGEWIATEGAAICFFGAGSFPMSGGIWSGNIQIRGAAVTVEGVDTHASSVSLSSGSLNVPAGVTKVLSLTMEGGGTGTLTGGGTVAVTESFVFTGGTMSGSGTTLLGPAVTGRMGGGVLLTQRTLSNEGVLTVEASTFLMADGAHLLNSGRGARDWSCARKHERTADRQRRHLREDRNRRRRLTQNDRCSPV